jgi:dihydrofolate synthase/folylpolyglutamate synthase
MGINLGLGSTRRLLEFIGNPQTELTTIHVAGTNGKGSVCAMIASVLQSAGKKVGLYTSPHLVHFNERIRVNGNSITDAEIVKFMKRTEPFSLKLQSTFFETTTALAFDHFRRHRVEVAVIETGLGGRLDSTNVIIPSLTVMTPISLDHMEILGKDLQTISEEKSGILKENIPLVYSEQNPIVEDILLKNAKKHNVETFKIDSTKDISLKDVGTEFLYRDHKYLTPLIGNHQAQNAALAVETIRIFDQNIKTEVIKKGLKTIIWPGRFQRISERLYYDVAHNEKGIECLIQTLKAIFHSRPIAGLFCLKGDKEMDLLAKQIKNQFIVLYVSSDVNGLLLDAKYLSKILNYKGVKNTLVDSVLNGINRLEAQIQKGAVGIIFGSHYIAEEVCSRN